MRIRAEMADYTIVLHAHIDSFEARLNSRLSKIQAPNLSVFHNEMATLCIDARSLAKILVPVIPSFT